MHNLVTGFERNTVATRTLIFSATPAVVSFNPILSLSHPCFPGSLWQVSANMSEPPPPPPSAPPLLPHKQLLYGTYFICYIILQFKLAISSLYLQSKPDQLTKYVNKLCRVRVVSRQNIATEFFGTVICNCKKVKRNLNSTQLAAAGQSKVTHASMFSTQWCGRVI